MALLEAYSDTNKVVNEQNSWTDGLNWANASTVTVYVRTITQSKYTYVGMTYAAAVSCAAAINNPPSVEAVVKRGSEAGSYNVEVMEITRGAWGTPE